MPMVVSLVLVAGYVGEGVVLGVDLGLWGEPTGLGETIAAYRLGHRAVVSSCRSSRGFVGYQ